MRKSEFNYKEKNRVVDIPISLVEMEGFVVMAESIRLGVGVAREDIVFMC